MSAQEHGWCTRCGHGYEIGQYGTVRPLPTCECAGDPPVDRTSVDYYDYLRRAARLHRNPDSPALHRPIPCGGHVEPLGTSVNPLRLDVPEDAWQPVAQPDEDDTFDERAKLAVTLNLSGLLMHVEAWEVLDESDPQATVVEDEDTDAIHSAVDSDGPWDTLTIRGREYVVVATPFC